MLMRLVIGCFMVFVILGIGSKVYAKYGDYVDPFALASEGISVTPTSIRAVGSKAVYVVRLIESLLSWTFDKGETFVKEVKVEADLLKDAEANAQKMLIS